MWRERAVKIVACPWPAARCRVGFSTRLKSFGLGRFLNVGEGFCGASRTCEKIRRSARCVSTGGVLIAHAIGSELTASQKCVGMVVLLTSILKLMSLQMLSLS
jgi:hypothetical protein